MALNPNTFYKDLAADIGDTFTTLFQKPINDAPTDTFTPDQKTIALAGAKKSAEDLARIISDKVTPYIKTADVLNVKTANDPGARLIDTLAALPTPNGSLLSAAGIYPVAGTIGDNILATATQTNKGTLN